MADSYEKNRPPGDPIVTFIDTHAYIISAPQRNENIFCMLLMNVLINHRAHRGHRGF